MRSRFDLLGHDGEDDVLVSSPHHHTQRVVFFDDGADVAGRRDRLPVDADDDVVFLQTSATRRQTGRLAMLVRFS